MIIMIICSIGELTVIMIMIKMLRTVNDDDDENNDGCVDVVVVVVVVVFKSLFKLKMAALQLIL